MNNYIEEFSFGEKPKNSYQILKIILIVIIIFVLGTIIIRSCSRVFDDEKIDERKLKEEAKYDMDKPFRELGIYSQFQLDDYLYEVSKYLKPKEFQNLIDWSDGGYRLKGRNWDAYENGWEILEQKFEWRTHDELIRRVVYKGNDWSILPLSEKFREKFKGVSIPEYYGYTDESVYRGDNPEYEKWIQLDIYSNGTTFSFEELTGNGEEMNKVYFKYYYDEDGYLDDIVLTDVVPYLDKNGWYVTKKDGYLMNKEQWIEIVLKYILPNGSYHHLEGNAGWQALSSPVYYKNVWQEIGMTDRFRDYFNSLDGRGLLPEVLVNNTADTRKSDNFYIENIDIDNCYAEAICEIVKEKKVKHYDVHWTTDDEYRLDSIDVELNHEEIIN